jgi:hypothetical protein
MGFVPVLPLPIFVNPFSISGKQNIMFSMYLLIFSVPPVYNPFLSLSLSLFFGREEVLRQGHYVAQAVLKLIIILPQTPDAGIRGVHCHSWFYNPFSGCTDIYAFIMLVPSAYIIKFKSVEEEKWKGKRQGENLSLEYSAFPCMLDKA